MGSLTINFADVEGGFEPLPEGEYECVIERVEVRESNSSDNDYLNIELKVLDEEYEDRKLWMIRSLSPKALFMLKDMLVTLEVIEEDEELDIEWDDDVDITPKEGPIVTNPDLVGIACTAVVTNEVYNGREKNRVDQIGLSGGGASARPKKAGAKKSTSKAKGGAKKSSGGRRKLR